MCGRFTLTVDANSLQLVFPWLNLPTQELSPRYNIAPNQPIAVISNDNKKNIDYFNWGLIPKWAKDPKIGNRMINARSETLAEKPSFRGSLKHHRCLIPADGFYEWANDPNDSYKIPHYIYLNDKSPFAFAGLWDTWISPDGSIIKSTTIITTEPNNKLKPIHNRMPVIVKPEYYDLWLSSDQRNYSELQHIFEPYPEDEISFHPVSRKVNTPGFDSIECIKNI